MKKTILLCSVMISCMQIFAQKEKEIDTLQNEPSKLSEVVVYANKFPELAKRVAQTVKVIKDKNTLNLQPNSADILINTGSVFVQKSQQGGGSPVIRGFEASRVLLMVDGVRLNNAIYRAGHLQNIITVDNMVLDRMEVLYGPSSTLYGSDALGGVVNMYTRNPKLSTNGKEGQVSGSSTLRYGSAVEEVRGNAILNIGGKEWASLTSVTFGSFGDMIQGKRRRDAYPSFGRKDFIVARQGNADIVLPNPNPERQVASGYQQVDLTQKFLYKPADNITHVLNIQYSNTNDVPRYDRLSEKSGSLPAFAEWYYGPQLRQMLAYTLDVNKLNGFFQEVKLTTSYQDVEESRITRRFNSNNKDSRVERVNVFGANFDAKHYSGKHELHVGAESYINYVRSEAERRNIVTGALSRINTRYPDGFNKMSNHAIYAQHTYKISDAWTLNDGLRLNNVYLNSKFADTSIMRFPFARATQNNLALTGNIGLVYASPKDLRIAFLLSSGFRSPNVDDLGRVFDSQIGRLIIPNPDVKPEYTYNAEINFNKYAERFSFGGSVFYTLFRNAIVIDKFQLNGQDSILYNGIRSGIFANQNKARAYLYGFSANGSFAFTKQTSIEAAYTYTYGRFNNNNSTIPLDHVPPTYGRVALKHKAKGWDAECTALFNGWKRIADYNPNGEDNAQYATVDGMPSWTIINLRSSVQVTNKIQAQVLLENVFDLNYRYFASGISAPGRNLVVSARVNF